MKTIVSNAQRAREALLIFIRNLILWRGADGKIEVRGEAICDLLLLDFDRFYELFSRCFRPVLGAPQRGWSVGLEELESAASQLMSIGGWVAAVREVAEFLIVHADEFVGAGCTEEVAERLSKIILQWRRLPSGDGQLPNLLDGLGAAPGFAMRGRKGGGLEVAVSAEGFQAMEESWPRWFGQLSQLGTSGPDWLTSMFATILEKAAAGPGAGHPHSDGGPVAPHVQQARSLGSEDRAAGRSRRSSAELFEAVGICPSDLPPELRWCAESELRAAYDTFYGAAGDLPKVN